MPKQPLKKSCYGVTLWGGCARLTISLSVLAWNENKGQSSRSPTSGGRKEGPREDKGQLANEPREGQLAKEDAERQSTTEGRGERSALSRLSRECQGQEKSEGRLLRPDELHRGGLTNTRRCQHCWCLFVEVSGKIHAGYSLQECKVSQNILLAHIVPLFFF